MTPEKFQMISPYYCEDGITIYNGDSRKIIPYLYQNLLYPLENVSVITDLVWPGAGLKLIGSDNPIKLFEEVWGLISPIRAGIQIGCDTDPRFLKCIQQKFFRVCWLEYVRPHYKGRLMYGADVAYLFGEPPPSTLHHRVIPGRFIDTSSKGKEHVKWLIDKWSSVNDVILDPFMGSGTSILAAKELGRKAIGIEIEEKYCKTAINRLRQTFLKL